MISNLGPPITVIRHAISCRLFLRSISTAERKGFHKSKEKQISKQIRTPSLRFLQSFFRLTNGKIAYRLYPIVFMDPSCPLVPVSSAALTFPDNRISSFHVVCYFVTSYNDAKLLGRHISKRLEVKMKAHRHLKMVA